jgi:initiation factor 1A
MSASVNRGGRLRRKNKTNRVKGAKREVIVDVENGDKFGTVEKILGGNQVLIKNHTGLLETVYIRGRMKKKQWIKIGNIVSINDQNEITSIVREGDKNSRGAAELINKSDNNGIYFNNSDSDSDDDDNDENNIDDNDDKNSLTIGDKNKLKLTRKEKDKQRDISRRIDKNDRQYTESKELDKDCSEIIKVENIEVSDDFDINDI